MTETNKLPKIFNPKTTLSRTLMAVNSEGKDTSKAITETVDNASYIWISQVN